MAGLERASYIKANNIATVDIEVFKEENFIGTLKRIDLKNAVKKINRFNKSGEEPW